jgi:hypothetical protein
MLSKSIHILKPQKYQTMKTCKNCKDDFEPTRSDQLYCSETCRYTFNNDKRKIPSHIRKGDLSAIMKNRNILETLAAGNLNNYDVDFLTNLGFDFEAMTKKDLEEEFYWCFEYGYGIYEDGSIWINYRYD